MSTDCQVALDRLSCAKWTLRCTHDLPWIPVNLPNSDRLCVMRLEREEIYNRPWNLGAYERSKFD